jgi:hypothetical protein
MKYKGSCHCGRVAFEAEGEIGQVLACNCSMCRRKGSLLWFIPKAQFRLTTPDANAATYLFNKDVIRHRFCATCGIHPYAEAKDRQGNPMAAINARCLDGVDAEKLDVKHFDGASL